LRPVALMVSPLAKRRRGYVCVVKHTSDIRRMFSFLSFSEKPKSLFKPKRTLSPSKRYAASPCCRRYCSSAIAIVDFPDAERPVNQMVKPRCSRKSLRSFRDSDGCHVMFLVRAHKSSRILQIQARSLGKWWSVHTLPYLNS